jgi:predicted O-methyltransferase YrrM
LPETADLAAVFVRLTRANRVLAIGTSDERSIVAIGRALPADGLLIAIERDAGNAAVLRQRVADAGCAPRVSIIAGDAARYLHKVAGPFELILQRETSVLLRALHDRVVNVLAPSATLLTFNLAADEDYNERLMRDRRLNTVVIGSGGLAISVRHKDRDDT